MNNNIRWMYPERQVVVFTWPEGICCSTLPCSAVGVAELGLHEAPTTSVSMVNETKEHTETSKKKNKNKQRNNATVL